MTFKQERLLSGYITYLQNARGQAASPLENRIIKALGTALFHHYLYIKPLLLFLFFISIVYLFPQGNCIPGKFHQSLASYIKTRVSVNKKQFLRHINDPNFVDILPISSESAIAVLDGIQV